MKVELYYVVRTDQCDPDTYGEFLAGPFGSWGQAHKKKNEISYSRISIATYEVVKQTIEVEL